MVVGNRPQPGRGGGLEHARSSRPGPGAAGRGGPTRDDQGYCTGFQPSLPTRYFGAV